MDEPRSASASRPQRANRRRRRRGRNNSRGRATETSSTSAPSQESRQSKRKKFEDEKVLRFRKLEEVSNMEPQEIIIELVCNRNGFKELLDSRNLTDDTLVLIVRVLRIVCLVPLRTNKMAMISLALNENFNKMLQNFILQMMFASERDKRNSSYFWKDVQGFFGNAHVVLQSIFETTPTKACEVIFKTIEVCNHTIKVLLDQDLISRDVKELFEKLYEKLKMYTAEIEIKKARQHSRDDYLEGEPPDDFRELTVYPTYDEIMSNSFVRKNLIDRPYNSVDHYLDVQFRLLKEDFVGPLRKGILEYQTCNTHFTKCRKFSNVRIHKEVKFIVPQCSRDQAGVLLQFEFFDPKKKRERKKYSFMKRFMYGSLVCFTRNNFETLLFGKIIERNQELLEKGQVVVSFDPGCDNYVLNEPYVMLECSVYFEPYYHVLKALQNIYEDTFAMRKYIIEVDADIVRPHYLTQEPSYVIQDFDVQLFSEQWPTAAELHLNDSQYSAFKAGLTQEYVVIQGPPGTGKTYLGLKLATTLIENKSHWHQGSPILIVCYTNHALDQFLEGLITVTDGVIRVGGQSKNEKLQMFNLKEKRSNLKLRGQGSNYGRAVYILRSELEACMRHIKKCSDHLQQIRNKDCIINFHEFSKIDLHYTTSWFGKATNDEIVEWLLDRKRIPRQQSSLQLVNDADALEKAEKEFDDMLNDQIIANLGNDDIDLNFPQSDNTKDNLLRVDVMLDSIRRIHTEIGTLEGDNDNMVFTRKMELTEKMFKLEDDVEYIQVMEMTVGCFTFIGYNCMRSFWLTDFEVKRSNCYKQYIELQHLQDIELMSQMLVVGMTTTSAARLQTVLQGLRSPIVIVEEAAEVLESHIVTSLTSHCKHLILIGDHQQLRPSTASYVIDVKFNLGISLFERMVRNNIQCHTLGVQHRMRPEIASLIVPAIYPKLDNHPSVENFPKVTGIDSNLYFIDHCNYEEEVHDSKVNRHEVKYLIALARHLILNGYKPEDVTILSAYSAQMFALWEERKQYSHLLQNVRITILDNYQGEESRIILLSLVRSNREGKIGFLKIENRVCVALSRAKEGLYIMGNMTLLCRGSQIWPKIKEALVIQNSLGHSLTLRCQIHPENVTQVRVPADFTNVSEGGCNAICYTIMNCGHVCPKSDCRRFLCEKEHLCPKMCFEECGPCMVMVKKTLKCSHVINVPCSTDMSQVNCMKLVTAKLPCEHTDSNKPCYIPVESHVCPFPCTVRVEPCGHACTLKCHTRDDPDHLAYVCKKKCEKLGKGCSTGQHKCQKDCYEECSLCEVLVKKRITTCTHRIEIPCHEDPNVIKCNKLCRRSLPCKHACKKKCSDVCGGCKVMVMKELSICKHKVRVKCNELPSRDLCSEPCTLELPCGHPCQATCKEACTKVCKHLVDHDKSADCGHKFKIECNLLNKGISFLTFIVTHTKMNFVVLPGNSYELLKHCDNPCRAELECGHICSGTCGSCAQRRIHRTCAQKCGRTLICGHECPFPCREACLPCSRECSYKCSHSSCGKQCGEPCTKCVEECQRGCEHSKCEKRCGDICSIPPCTMPCKKSLVCGHLCVGFCGDPCPPLCRICNNDELTEMFFGTEDEEDVRFVVLDECNHIVESSGMEQWMAVGDDNSVNYKCCPKCKTPLSSTRRYTNYIKQSLEDVHAIKLKYFGNPLENQEKQIELLNKMKDLETTIKEVPDSVVLLHEIVNDLKNSTQLVYKGRKITLNSSVSRIYLSKMQILENIVKIFTTTQLRFQTVVDVAIEHMNFLLGFLSRQENMMTKQEISDFRRETNRFSRKLQLLKITENSDLFKVLIEQNSLNKKLYETVYDYLSSTCIFNDSLDEELGSKIDDLSKQFGTLFKRYEQQQAAQAMKMVQGCWFKCTNGHYYAVGGCGSAVQAGKCIECGVAVGRLGY
ncbi:hypothetical protein RI129_011284 [Pyrocoelia pectoralis]|uniref:RZ-type domain-containing protein n=1 Tax=Pyrocoelia pectoralis TaxID=417401 RepID=A0AAN7V7N0_9COLE